jgi:hypothetical protein
MRQFPENNFGPVGGCGGPFDLSTGPVVLTTTPTQYTINISGHYVEIVAAFGWVITNVPVKNQSLGFYEDDIV